jgi:hypothetical protein
MVDANALNYAKPDPERDAADRLTRLHGALELKATLLALLLPPGSHRAVRAYEIETADIRPAASLRAHVDCLPGGARPPWLELLLARMASQPIGLRQELLQATRRVMSARGVARPIDRLHWLAMRRALGEPLVAQARSPTAGDVSEWLEPDLIAIANYSAFLARMVPVESAAGDSGESAVGKPGAEWYANVMEPWQGGALLPGCDPPSGEVAIRALNTLQSLTMMQRPVLVRGWVVAALNVHRKMALTDSAADALRLSSGLLDTPMPPELARHYPVIEAASK